MSNARPPATEWLDSLAPQIVPALTEHQLAVLRAGYIEAHTCPVCRGSGLGRPNSLGKCGPCWNCEASPGRSLPGDGHCVNLAALKALVARISIGTEGEVGA